VVGPKKWYKNDEHQNKACQISKEKTTKQVVVVPPIKKKRLGEMGLGKMLPMQPQLGRLQTPTAKLAEYQRILNTFSRNVPSTISCIVACDRFVGVIDASSA